MEKLVKFTRINFENFFARNLDDKTLNPNYNVTEIPEPAYLP